MINISKTAWRRQILTAGFGGQGKLLVTTCLKVTFWFKTRMLLLSMEGVIHTWILFAVKETPRGPSEIVELSRRWHCPSSLCWTSKILQSLLNSPYFPWVTEGLPCELGELANRALNTNSSTLVNQTLFLWRCSWKITFTPWFHLPIAMSLNTCSLKGWVNVKTMGHIQAVWSAPWELGSESGVLFGPWGHHLTTLPFSILSIFCPAQSSLCSLMMLPLMSPRMLSPVLSRLGHKYQRFPRCRRYCIKKK